MGTATVDDTSCQLLGCMEATEPNYDSWAQVADGSCDYSLFACTNPAAINYKSAAVDDNGDCKILGCMDSTMSNYNSATTHSGEPRIPYRPGCTDSGATNYNADYNEEDGTCIILGCTDSTFENYFSQANTEDDATFKCHNYGCTQPAAKNFDSSATMGNGQDVCEFYPPPPPPSPLAPGTDIIHVQLEIEGDINSYPAGTEERVTFETSIVSDLASFLAIDAARVIFLSMKGGSILVDLFITGTSSDAKSAAQAVQELKAAGSFELGQFTVLSVRVLTSSPPPLPPPPEPPSDDGGGSSGPPLVIIIVVVVVVVVVCVGVAGIVYLQIMKKKRLAASTVMPAVGERAVVQPPPLPAAASTPAPPAEQPGEASAPAQPTPFRDRVPMDPPQGVASS